jgi:hypothetical protein
MALGSTQHLTETSTRNLAVKTHTIVRRRGFHIFYTVDSQMAVRLPALRPGSPLPFMNITGTHFCQRLSDPRTIVRLEGLGKLKKIQ